MSFSKPQWWSPTDVLASLSLYNNFGLIRLSPWVNHPPPPPKKKRSISSQIAPYYRVGVVWTFWRKITNMSQKQTNYWPKTSSKYSMMRRDLIHLFFPHITSYYWELFGLFRAIICLFLRILWYWFFLQGIVMPYFGGKRLFGMVWCIIHIG